MKKELDCLFSKIYRRSILSSKQSVISLLLSRFMICGSISCRSSFEPHTQQ